MRKTIDKIARAALMAAACVSLVMMTCETSDGSTSLLWSLGWMAALAASVKALDRMGAFDGEEDRV